MTYPEYSYVQMISPQYINENIPGPFEYGHIDLSLMKISTAINWFDFGVQGGHFDKDVLKELAS